MSIYLKRFDQLDTYILNIYMILNNVKDLFK